MSKILKCAVVVTLLSSSSMAGQLNLLNGEPEKIEYYGRDYSYPPITIKLAKGSKLYKRVEKLLSDDGWFFGIGGSKLPEIYVVGKDTTFSANIEPGIAGVSYTTKQGRRTWRINKINAEVYTEIEASILVLIEQAKKGEHGEDVVVFPKPPEPYVPETVEDMLVEEITTDDTRKLLDISLPDEVKLALLGDIFSRIQNNPAYPESLKKEMEKEQERLTDQYMGMAAEFKLHFGDVNPEDLEKNVDVEINWFGVARSLLVNRPWERGANSSLKNDSDSAQATKTVGAWRYVILVFTLSIFAIVFVKRKRRRGQ